MMDWQEVRILPPGYCNRETIVLSDREKKETTPSVGVVNNENSLGKCSDLYFVKPFCIASGES